MKGVEELVPEHGRPDLRRRAIDGAEQARDTTEAAAATALGDLDRSADNGPPTHIETDVGDHPLEAAPSEETHVASVEDAATVVVEAADRNATTRVPMGEVRDAGEDPAVASEPADQFGQQLGRLNGVLQHVGGDDRVEAATDLGGKAVVEICFEEGVEPVPHVLVLDEIDAGHVVPELPHEDERPAYEELGELTDGLPPKERAAVVLRYGYDLSYEQIAAALDSSPDAARQAASTGVRRLRKEKSA